MGRKLTHEEFMERFYKKNKNAENIEILEQYKGSKIKIKCKCRIDNYIWYPTPHDLLDNCGCPICGEKSKIEKNTKTHEEFIQEFYKKNKNAENIEILEEYKGANIKIKVRCKIDDYKWEVIPNSLLRDTGCPKCYGRILSTHEEFMERFYKKNKNAENIEILGEYKNNKTKIKCRCKIDEYEWSATPHSLLDGKTGCPKCAGKIKDKTTKYFIQEMKKINDDIEILGKYKGTGVKIKCRCKIDNHIWYATPNNLLNNHGCPKCNASKGEKRIAKYLDNKNIKYIHDKQYFKDLKNNKNGILRPDFIIENMKIWIEFDGEQHFRVVDFSSKNKELAKEQFRIIQENDKLKNEYAKEHGWKLIRIPYWEYNNIEEILDRELEEFLK